MSHPNPNRLPRSQQLRLLRRPHLDAGHLDDAPSRAALLAVLRAIDDRIGSRNPDYVISREDLVEQTGWSLKTVSRALATLEELQVIGIERRQGYGKLPSRFCINWATLQANQRPDPPRRGPDGEHLDKGHGDPKPEAVESHRMGQGDPRMGHSDTSNKSAPRSAPKAHVETGARIQLARPWEQEAANHRYHRIRRVIAASSPADHSLAAKTAVLVTAGEIPEDGLQRALQAVQQSRARGACRKPAAMLHAILARSWPLNRLLSRVGGETFERQQPPRGGSGPAADVRAG